MANITEIYEKRKEGGGDSGEERGERRREEKKREEKRKETRREEKRRGERRRAQKRRVPFPNLYYYDRGRITRQSFPLTA